MIFSALVVAAVVVLAMCEPALWKGIAAVVILMFLVVLAIEANSKSSILTYHKELTGKDRS